jgi:LysM repeat protein
MVRRNLLLALSLVAAGALAVGCGNTKRVESTEVPKQAPPAEQPKMTESSHYTVALNDTLWGIAGKSDIYSDNFQWPLIFKANRDTIKDPDLIYPNQDFVIQKGMTEEEISNAHKLAMETPKYTPHSKPRETLPIDYF